MYISTSCSLEATHTTGRRLSSERGLLGASETWPRPRALAVFSGGGRLGEGNVELWRTFQATGAGWLAGEKRLGVGLKTDRVGFGWMVLQFFLFVGTRFGWRCHVWCLTKGEFPGTFPDRELYKVIEVMEITANGGPTVRSADRCKQNEQVVLSARCFGMSLFGCLVIFVGLVKAFIYRVAGILLFFV